MFLGNFDAGNNALPEISNSLRFNSASSSYLYRTLPNSSGATKSALSLWVKRSALGTYQSLFALGGDSNNYGELYFNGADNLALYANSGGSTYVAKISTAVYRDISAWYHIVCLVDTTLATAEDRFQLWVNGTRITSFSTNTNTWTQSTSFYFGQGSTRPTWIGANYSTYLNGYISRMCFVYQPTTLPTVSDFAFTDKNGQWRSKSANVCKAVVETGSTNSFMLNFDNGTSLTTLGYDYSNKGNNWTLSGFTRSAGASECWMTDTPTNNYAVLNSLQQLWVSLGAGTVSDGNLKLTSAATLNAYSYVASTIQLPNTGKWFFEGQFNGSLSASTGQSLGIMNWSNTLNVFMALLSTGTTSYKNGVSWQSGLSVINSGDIFGVAYDADNLTVQFYRNGSTFGTQITGITAGEYYFFVETANTSVQNNIVANFGQRAFTYTPPTGYKALCAKNLPIPSIIKPTRHFDVVGWAGDNTNKWQTNTTAFNADLCWIKNRSSAYSNVLVDIVRGNNNGLRSDTTAVEDAGTTGVLIGGYGAHTAYPGQVYTNGTGYPELNTTGNNYINWRWRANGTGVINTDGSITSTVSANRKAGFSIVTFSGLGSVGTVGHGLGVTPAMLIFKSRNNVGTTGWNVWHQKLSGSNYYLGLSSTAAQSNAASNFSGTWNSTVFGLTATPLTSGANLVAYAFAEIPGYSKFGNYTGNGSIDGPFVWCGFRPKFILFKRIDVANDWGIYDTLRDVLQPLSYYLMPNSSSSEQATGNHYFDLLSNGFKLRNANAFSNISGGNYIFAAFAEIPFKYASAR